MGKISLISLGCPKNLADSEKLIESLSEKGIDYSSDTENSDIIIVNTCGFIEDAKKESVEEILKLSAIKAKDKKKRLVVFGCLAKRYGEELKKEIPEIDAIWGVGQDRDIVEYCSNILFARQSPLYSTRSLAEKRIKAGHGATEKLSDTPYAYLKIADGCNRKCSYCIIPEIRGKFRSSKSDAILMEAERLVKSGTRELILVAQDITSYGKDFGKYNISRLIRDLASVKGDFWIRLLYLYPTSITDELIDTIKNEKKVCKYIDMPLQHSEDRMLKLMGRGGSRQTYEKLILKIRKKIPDISLRTTLIVGFPEETSADFEGMKRFVQEMRFDRLGVFKYSNEEGTDAYKLKGQVMKKIKDERYGSIMKVQSEISYEKNRALLGKTFMALVDEVDTDIAIARIYSQAPEIDGVVMIKNNKIKKGDFVDVRIEEAYDYDLKGTVIG